MPTKPTKPRPGRPKSAAGYHHGNLRQVLIETTLELLEKVGPEQVTVRKVAQLAGVSSGAPFRHFPDRSALMTAVAEEAMGRLQEEVAASLKNVADRNPLLRFRAIGEAWVRWAVRNPSHFKVITDRRLLDQEGAAVWGRQSQAIQAEGSRLLGEAQQQGLLADVDIKYFHLAGRSLAFGFARMYIDGHFAGWNLHERDVDQIWQSVMDAFFRTPRRPSKSKQG